MIKITFLLVSILAFITPPHAGHTTYFNFHFDKAPNELVIEMESNYLGWMLNNSSKKTNAKAAISDYLNEHLKIHLNKKPCLLKVATIKPNEFGHTFINIELAHTIVENIKTIAIENTCFLKNVTEQVNVIMIYQKDKEMSGFKLNKDRTEITATL